MTSDKIHFKSTGQNVHANSPKVSVIIPAYNIAKYVEETLDSVLAQTFKDFEIIVINDGSPDTIEFEKVLKPYFDQIIYLKIENIGAGAARNIAIEHSRGELLAFLDGDDIWYPEFLESQVKFLETSNYDLVYTDADLFGESGLNGQTYMQTSPSSGKANFESLLDLKCNVITSGTIAKKQLVVNAGMFETEKVRAHDFHLWLRMAKQGAKIGYQKKVLLKYRIRLDSLSGNSVQRIQREIDVYKRVSRMIELNEAQQNIIQKHLTRLEADIEIETGKIFLLEENFEAARKSFEKANKHHKSNSLRAIILLTKISPRLLLKLYKFRRADEIAFVPHTKKQTN